MFFCCQVYRGTTYKLHLGCKKARECLSIFMTIVVGKFVESREFMDEQYVSMTFVRALYLQSQDM